MVLHILSSQAEGLAGLFVLILVDVVVAYVQAIRTKTWNWSKVGQFTQKLVTHLGGLMAAAVLANGTPSLSQVTQPAWWGAAIAAVVQVVAGDIAPKLHGLQSPKADPKA